MSNLVIKNTTIYTIGNILPKAGSLILLPIITKYLSTEGYGIVSSLLVLDTVFMIVFTLAMDRSIFRLYFDFKKESDKQTFLSTITFSLIIFATLMLILLFALNEYIGQIYRSIPFYPYFALVILSSYSIIYTIVPKSYLRVTENAKKFVLISITQFLVKNSFILFIILFIDASAEGYMWGYMVGSVILLPYFIYLSARIINYEFDKNILRDSLRFTIPIIPGLIAGWILNLSDRVFIERMINVSELGIYSLGYNIAGVIIVFSGAFQQAYSPHFFKVANSNNSNTISSLSKSNKIYLLFVLSFCFCISFFSKDVIYIFFSDEFLPAYRITILVSVAYFVSQINWLLNQFIYQAKRTSRILIITLLSAITNVILNFTLIPVYGIHGAAYSTVLTFITTFIITFYLARKTFYIKLNWFIIFGGLLALIISYLINSYPVFESIYTELLIKISIISITFLIILKYYWSDIKLILAK